MPAVCITMDRSTVCTFPCTYRNVNVSHNNQTNKNLRVCCYGNEYPAIILRQGAYNSLKRIHNVTQIINYGFAITREYLYTRMH